MGGSALVVALAGALAGLVPALVTVRLAQNRDKHVRPKEENELVSRIALEGAEAAARNIALIKEERASREEKVARLESERDYWRTRAKTCEDGHTSAA